MMTAAAVAGALCLGALALIFFAQRQLIYFPDTTYYEPGDAGLSGVEQIVLRAGDGAEALVWYAPAPPGGPTILYFHGNGGGLINRTERIRMFTGAGMGVFLMSYRGYSGGKGRPSEAANVSDAQAAYDQLIARGVSPRDIVAYGESLGTGVAVQLAAAREVGAVVLEAPYTSLVDMGKEVYPFLPVQALLLDRYDTKAHIAKIRAPLLILHGGQDSVVPARFGRALFDAAPQPKEMHLIANAGHSDIYAYGAFPLLQRFIEARRTAGGGAGGQR
jgi:fermentation-respiration switch protein FrsA (DUF1100 family)